MADKNPYRPIEAQVLDVIAETPTIRTVRFKTKEEVAFVTGQFIELTIPGVGEAPFTPSSRPSMREAMEVTVMKVGRVTEFIHKLKKGDIIGIRGPFGRGYPLDEFKGKEILVVGGGCGFAPLRSLMYTFFDMSGQFKKLFFRGGCRTPKELVYRNETDEWAKRKDLNFKLTVDNGDESWKGNVGLVTTILDDVEMDYKQGIGVVCGPPIMMKFAAKKLLEMGFKENNLYLSMEKNMSCGIGKCGHCRLGSYYACKDGPVFSYDKIKNFPNIWD
ncbi:MAG: FAD/NAD(P)-binding protein [Candidatus Omnitrophica bacterium]|nr:FAD/NAD(P)-binding protein [Candidatus Omnitrophota bacterium]MBU1925962.1 FAD/NAD(P)-binding protein [Candidatus Omnitrophota bacterium]MBU2063429.1 FAD/NAD(P)-binding protein [Candidatus Omnitrophota bacterium]